MASISRIIQSPFTITTLHKAKSKIRSVTPAQQNQKSFIINEGYYPFSKQHIISSLAKFSQKRWLTGKSHTERTQFKEPTPSKNRKATIPKAFARW
jgi:hypothetical protein